MEAAPDDPVFWREASRLYDLLVDLGPPEREAALLAATPDPALQQAVRRWLATGPSVRIPEICPLPPDGLELPGLLAPGTVIGAWRVTRLAGEGGMGLVYEAERADGSFERRVALKVMSGPANSRAILDRFLAERRILAGLEHPNIAQLLDAGLTAEGEPWFAMEYVDGAPIRDWCQRRRLDRRGIVRLFRQVTSAVAHAHRRLVIHRDLKPSNILIAADGTAKLLDFGIAELATAPGERRVAARMLTPAYASPEQREGGESTIASDVYSLGVVLHELLTGTRPEAARPPDPGPVGGDLAHILGRALEAEPARRYPSVEALDSDLSAWLDGLPVRARPDTWRYRTACFLRRHPVAVLASAAAVVALVTLTLVARAQATRARDEARRAEQVASFLVGLLELPYPFDSAETTVSMRAMLDAGRAQADSLIAAGNPPDPQILESLALGYSGLADFEQSAAVNRQALRLRQARGQSDSAQSISRLLIAAAEMLGGHEVQARATLLPAIEPVRRAYGPTSDRLAQFLVTLLNIERRLGNLARADSLGREALRIIAHNGNQARNALGHAHTQLGHVAMERGDWRTAEAEYRASLEARTGASRLEMGSSMANIALAVAEQGRHDEAARLLAEARGLKASLVDPGDPEMSDQLRQEARLAALTGDHRRAAAMYRDALARYAQRGSSPHWRTTPALVGLGQALVATGDYASAEPPLRAALDSVARRIEGQSRLRAEARRALAEVLRRQRRTAAADSLERLAGEELALLRGY